MSTPAINGAGQSGLVHLSTDGFAESDRLPIWREVYGRHLFNLEIETIGEERFYANVKLRALPGANILLSRRSASRTSITRPLLQSASDSLVLAIIMNGRGHAAQLGREIATPIGGAVLMSSAEAASHALLDDGQLLSIAVPRGLIAPYVQDLGDQLMRPLAPDLDALRLLTDYARGAMALSDGAGSDLQGLAAVHLRDLLIMTIGVRDDARGLIAGRGVRAARVRAVKRAIIAQLDRPDLSAETVALSLRISANYVRKLVSSEAGGFSDYVLGLRLERAFAALRDPRLFHQTISSVAFGAGFSDISYFNRRFRQRFGMTPGDARFGRLT